MHSAQNHIYFWRTIMTFARYITEILLKLSTARGLILEKIDFPFELYVPLR